MSAVPLACGAATSSDTPPASAPGPAAAPVAPAADDAAPSVASTNEPPAAPTESALLSGPAYSLDSHTVQLQQNETKCSVRVTPGEGSALDLPLELLPPCYWLRWPYPPPSKPAESGGQPLGHKDEPMAWTYSDAGPTTAVIVIGGPLEEDDPDRRRKLEEHHCGQRTQAVLLTAGEATVTERMAEGSVYCERSGSDEREFWLFAHDG